ncbi:MULTISPECIES: hydrogenase nickel incorporation protein HypB [unclassified Flavobacterium]|jgi:hydrogenase nickel incorporation protein HypB|uniref:hydrogenase nickel incorporation protein HypB n=1 Tax=unclassified Flavobacterium TaxID=196869 RepID=UPI0025C59DC7|nr:MULTISPECIES: hydrogenase nickel incorporation protein HypB [unclassified Flavobacterium]
MCVTCGCNSDGNGARIIKVDGKAIQHSHTHYHGQEHHDHSHSHDHDHDHSHTHEHHHDDHQNAREINLEKEILHKNDLLAERNKGYFEAKNIFAINLVSSPGSGKTSLLERTIADLKNEISFNVIEGDQQTTNDADRIAALKVPVIQINTGKGCHLDSEMIAKAVKELSPKDGSLMMIENVGNLVCPAMFDLGENIRVVIISITEGEDKPIKYPDMFYGSQVCIINKIDLLPYLKFDMEKLKEYAKKVNPNLEFFEVSAYTGEGMETWYNFLKKSLKS